MLANRFYARDEEETALGTGCHGGCNVLMEFIKLHKTSNLQLRALSISESWSQEAAQGECSLHIQQACDSDTAIQILRQRS